MSIASGSGSSCQRQTPLSQASQPELESLPLSTSPQPESINDSEPIEVDGAEEEEEEEEGVDVGSKRKLTSAVWKEFKRVKYMGTVKAKCMHCSKKLSGATKNGTKHLQYHLKICVQKKIKLKGKTLTQSALRFSSANSKNLTVENYTFEQNVARRELCNMIVLHEYPSSIVDHVGFRRYVAALQPLFKIGTRNTIRYDSMAGIF
jgi:hypothetical protein